MFLCKLSFFLVFLVTAKLAICESDYEVIQMLVKETVEKQLNLHKETTSSKISELMHENEQLRKRVTNLEIRESESHLSANNILEVNATSGTKARRLLGQVIPNCQCRKHAAFSVSLTNHLTNLGKYQTIMFDNVITNDNNVYTLVTGIFTAPNNGTYFFTATIMSHHNQYVETEIALNGKGLVKMYSRDSQFEQGTNSVVVTLKTGDMVWVRHHDTDGSNIYGGQWSSFSGFEIN